jgi:hypothetical protein
MRCQNLTLLLGQLKEKVVRKSVPIALDRLIEPESWNSVDLCEIGIENDAPVSNNVDRRINVEGF